MQTTLHLIFFYPKVIAKKLIDKGVYSENEIIYTILNDDFSTKENITMLSGRGVGLAAVKQEVENLYSSISIDSKVSVGTTFSINVPVNEYQ